LEDAIEEGISDREYFIAHAPPLPNWFVVQFFDWPDDLPQHPMSWTSALTPEKVDCVETRWKLKPWSEKRRCELAWPRAWANAMLAEQEKQE